MHQEAAGHRSASLGWQIHSDMGCQTPLCCNRETLRWRRWILDKQYCHWPECLEASNNQHVWHLCICAFVLWTICDPLRLGHMMPANPWSAKSGPAANRERQTCPLLAGFSTFNFYHFLHDQLYQTWIDSRSSRGAKPCSFDTKSHPETHNEVHIAVQQTNLTCNHPFNLNGHKYFDHLASPHFVWTLLVLSNGLCWSSWPSIGWRLLVISSAGVAWCGQGSLWTFIRGILSKRRCDDCHGAVAIAELPSTVPK